MKKQILYIIICCTSVVETGIARTLSLKEAIHIASEHSFDAYLAKFRYEASYWTYKSFLAELKPSANLYGDFLNFKHSKVEARNYEDGRINYVDDNSMSNSLSISIDQQVSALGGKLSIQSYLYRLDQYNYDLLTFNSQPLKISYSQPLISYNELKWKKKIYPKQYEKAKREYLESIESIALTTSELFFNAITSQSQYKQCKNKNKDLNTLYEISKKRFALGTLTKSELLQLELSLLNSQIDMVSAKAKQDEVIFELFSYLHINNYEDIELLIPREVPNIIINIDLAQQMALNNSSHQYEQDLSLLTAQQSLAQAKSAKGIQMQVSGEMGFLRTTNEIQSAYNKLQDNEIVGLKLSLPIFDWGVQKGKVKVAKSNLELVKTQIEQNREAYLQQIKQLVVMLNMQNELYQTSKRVEEISLERYDITKKKFESGTVSVTDLNTAIQDQESARIRNINQLKNYWIYYLSLRKATLYDWIGNHMIDVGFDFQK